MREEANRKQLSKLRAVAELFRGFIRPASYRVGGVGDTTLIAREAREWAHAPLAGMLPNM